MQAVVLSAPRQRSLSDRGRLASRPRADALRLERHADLEQRAFGGAWFWARDYAPTKGHAGSPSASVVPVRGDGRSGSYLDALVHSFPPAQS